MNISRYFLTSLFAVSFGSTSSAENLQISFVADYLEPQYICDDASAITNQLRDANKAFHEACMPIVSEANRAVHEKNFKIINQAIFYLDVKAYQVNYTYITLRYLEETLRARLRNEVTPDLCFVPSGEHLLKPVTDQELETQISYAFILRRDLEPFLDEHLSKEFDRISGLTSLYLDLAENVQNLAGGDKEEEELVGGVFCSQGNRAYQLVLDTLRLAGDKVERVDKGTRSFRQVDMPE